MTSEPRTSFDSEYHAPVLASEVVQLLRNAKSVLDGTLGGGGHSEALLTAGAELVVGVDRDPDALRIATQRLEAFVRQRRFVAVRGDYSTVAEHGGPEPAAGLCIPGIFT